MRRSLWIIEAVLLGLALGGSSSGAYSEPQNGAAPSSGAAGPNDGQVTFLESPADAPTDVRLDKLLYDPTGSPRSVALWAAQGQFRLRTGSEEPRKYEVKTPFGMLDLGK